MATADTANDKPDASHNPYCKATAAKAVGQTFSVDLVRTGKINGTDRVLTATGDEQTSIVA